jgi:hypothetical protein
MAPGALARACPRTAPHRSEMPTAGGVKESTPFRGSLRTTSQNWPGILPVHVLRRNYACLRT